MTLANIALVKRDGTDFSDLDANLDAEQIVDTSAPKVDSSAVEAFYGAPQAKPEGEICYKCKGSGRYRVGNHQYGTYRDLGPCFTCGGSGSVSAAVAKAHRTKETNKAAKAAEQNTWLKEHGDVTRWIGDKLPYSGFAQSLNTHFEKTGRLSVGQVIAVRKILAENVERAKARELAVVAAAPQGNGLSLSHVPAGRYAVPNGDTRLKVLIKKPEAPSKWAGFIFVSDGAEYGQARNYGRQAPGKTYSGMIENELRQIAADPRAAAVAYGKLTGTCCLCGRKLENEASVEAGIGPICAAKEGWNV